MQQGYIKLYRKLLESPLWQSCKPERKIILITILLKANHKKKTIILDSTREEISILPGQFVTSRKKLAEACGKGISEQMVRSALVDFQKHGFLTKQSTSKSTKGYTLITVENWELYQGYEENQPSNKPIIQPSINQASTTNKNEKNEKNNIYSRVIDHLNKKASKNFKSTTKKTKSCIDARIKEGFKEADFLKVIDIKTEEWKDNPSMNQYLRPQTLFGSKFEGYLQQEIKQDLSEEKDYDIEKLAAQFTLIKPDEMKV